MKAEHHHCRWPCKNTRFMSMEKQLFCGAKKLPGISYCRQHARRAFVPIGRAKREYFSWPVSTVTGGVIAKKAVEGAVG